MRKDKYNYFTLVELIAVVIILGIIAMTAIPKYYDLKTKAENSVAEGVLAASQSALTLNWSAVLAGSSAVSLIETGSDLVAEIEELDTDWIVSGQAITWTTVGGDSYVLTLSDSSVGYSGKQKQRVSLVRN